jgi:hypothetical protein
VVRTAVNQVIENSRQTVTPPAAQPSAASPSAPRQSATPEDEAFKQQCESQDAALDETGWFRDRYSQ